MAGFISRYEVTRLVRYGAYDRSVAAIVRENAMKKWRRAWKVELIEAMNPEWTDLDQILNG